MAEQGASSFTSLHTPLLYDGIAPLARASLSALIGQPTGAHADWPVYCSIWTTSRARRS